MAAPELACGGVPVSTAAAGGPSTAPGPGPAKGRGASKTPAEATLGDRAWGVLRSDALGLKVALPEARSWLPDSERPPGGSRWSLLHEPTGSTLVLRAWRASRLPQVEVCQQELFQRSPELPEMNETNLIASRSVRVPEGFVTRINLLVVPNKNTHWRGLAVAIGAGVGSCLAAVAETECGSEAELIERLRLFDIALAHLRKIQIEDRVPAPAAPLE